ncbi:YadA C-terminal domain-containing protein [Vibrio sp. DW001]|uniref:YadA C-terminal domain-containing protein n=1 Tax=Vibrio sp. DW001 TaxID=2912315 RepID=UPI0023AF1B8D|nr:YadA C-terminal domain-containing protein [Vibrio sp. DW001]WED28820.1 YadA C-terminal domain-containing protein [Vibrio sp. DW001]
MNKSIITLSLISVFSTQAIAGAQIENPIWNGKPSIDNSVPGIAERPQPQVPTQPPVDSVPDRPEKDSTPDRIQPTDPEFGLPYEPQMPSISDSQRISSLELDFERMANQLEEQSEQMDGVRASLHAVTNARPFVTNGEFAIGTGVGFAGSKEALAIGGAYGINEKLSVSGTFHYETKGKHSSSDVAGGVGVQYTFN